LQLLQPADYDDSEVDDNTGSMENTEAPTNGQLQQLEQSSSSQPSRAGLEG